MTSLESQFRLALQEIRSLRGLCDECSIPYSTDFSVEERDYRHLYRERELHEKSEELEVTKALLMLQNLRSINPTTSSPSSFSGTTSNCSGTGNERSGGNNNQSTTGTSKNKKNNRRSVSSSGTSSGSASSGIKVVGPSGDLDLPDADDTITGESGNSSTHNQKNTTQSQKNNSQKNNNQKNNTTAEKQQSDLDLPIATSSCSNSSGSNQLKHMELLQKCGLLQQQCMLLRSDLLYLGQTMSVTKDWVRVFFKT